MSIPRFAGLIWTAAILAASLMAGTLTLADEGPSPPTLTIVSSDEEGITLKVDFHGYSSQPVVVDGPVRLGSTTYDVLEIPGCGKLDEIGRPALPVFGTMISVPAESNPRLLILDATSRMEHDVFVYPTQPLAADEDGEMYPTPPFTIDDAYYSQDESRPTAFVSLGAAGWVRDERVLPIRFTAFQFNPVRRELIAYSSITARIYYYAIPSLLPLRPSPSRRTSFSLLPDPMLSPPKGATSSSFTNLFAPTLLSRVRKPGKTVQPSPYFETFFSSLPNHHPNAEAPLAMTAVPGCDFLIIAAPQLVDAANALAARRNTQGLVTFVRTTNDTGTTAADIKAYIQNAYDTWTPRPSYLLLLGDAELIPTHYRTVHGWYGPSVRTGTDIYYAILNGPENAPPYYQEYWTPDIYYGRIPVDTLDQANVVIHKIFDYEDNQWNSGLAPATIAGYFQDGDGDGFEDRRFILTAEEIRDYLVGQSIAVDRLYTTNPLVTPTNYNLGAYDSGLGLPTDLLRPTYPWNADSTAINDAINAGRFLVLHRDHGGSGNSGNIEGWGDPFYVASDVAALNNEDNYAVVMTINCETGWFDGETDDYAANNTESLSETFLRRDGGGAVGVIGATRVSYSGWNDDMAKGFIDAIWPDFDTNRGPAASQLRMGEVLNYGKFYMNTVRGSSDLTEWEIFHYFGDPTMRIEVPSKCDAADNVPPVVRILPVSRIVIPTTIPLSLVFEASDDDGFAGDVIFERILLSGLNVPSPCLLFDGRTYGDQDGLLTDETISISKTELQRLVALCGFTEVWNPTITVEAEDCRGNVGSDSRTAQGAVRVLP